MAKPEEISSGEPSKTGAPPPRGALSASLEFIVNGLNGLGSIWIFVLMVLINVDATGRTLFARPVEGVIELVEMSIVVIVFLQLGDATRRGRLTRSDGLFNQILARRPTIGRRSISSPSVGSTI